MGLVLTLSLFTLVACFRSPAPPPPETQEKNVFTDADFEAAIDASPTKTYLINIPDEDPTVWAKPLGEPLELPALEKSEGDLEEQGIHADATGIVAFVRHRPTVDFPWHIVLSDQTTGENTTVYRGKREINSVAVNGVGDTLFLSLRQTGATQDFELYKVTLNPKVVTRLTNNTFDDTNVSVSADGNILVWEGSSDAQVLENGEVVTYNRRAVHWLDLENAPDDLRMMVSKQNRLDPSVSGDGKTIAFVTSPHPDDADFSERQTIALFDIATFSQIQSVFYGYKGELKHPSVANDNKTVSWLAIKPNGTQRVMLARTENGETTITNAAFSKTDDLRHPFLSADGAFVVYRAVNQSGRPVVRTKNTTTGEFEAALWASPPEDVSAMVWQLPAGTTPPPTDPPVAVIGLTDTILEAGETLGFDSSASTGTNLTYEWELRFNDAWVYTTTGVTGEYSFSEPGSGYVLLRVRDDAGRVAVQTANITVTEVLDPIPAPWQEVTLAGEATAGYNSDTGSFSLICTSSTGESSQFVYQELSTDATLTARVQRLVDSSGKAGLMLRDTNESASPYVYVYLDQTGIKVDYKEGGDTVQTIAHRNVTTPGWLRLERKEGSVLVYESDDGVNFTLITTITLALANPFNLGLASSSNVGGCNDRFSAVQLQLNDRQVDGKTVTQTIGPEGGRIWSYDDEETFAIFSEGFFTEPTVVTFTILDEQPNTYIEDFVNASGYPVDDVVPVARAVELRFSAANLRYADVGQDGLGGVYIPPTVELTPDAGRVYYVEIRKRLETHPFELEFMEWEDYSEPDILAFASGSIKAPYQDVTGDEEVILSFQPVSLPTADSSGTGDSTLIETQALNPIGNVTLEGLYAIQDNESFESLFEQACRGSDKLQRPLTLATEANAGMVDAERTPLILVHGWQVLVQFQALDKTQFFPGLCAWEEFTKNYTNTDSTSAGLQMLRDEYQLFTYSYNSENSIHVNAQQLADKVSSVFGNQEVVLLAHSMGGLVSNIYREEFPNNIRRIITAATPNMGSSMLNCKASIPLGIDGYSQCGEAEFDDTVKRNLESKANFLPLGAFINWLEFAINSYQGTRDLSWQPGGISISQKFEPCNLVGLCPVTILSEDNPILTEINGKSAFDKRTALYGVYPDTNPLTDPEKILANALRDETGHENDGIVPFQSACLSSQPNNCSDTRFSGNLIFVGEANHGEVKSLNVDAITVELLRVAGRLLDIDDGTPDGNQRIAIGNEDTLVDCSDYILGDGSAYKGDGVCNEAAEAFKPMLRTSIDFGGEEPREVIENGRTRWRRFGEDADRNERFGDDQVDMSDFRRWRDWYLRLHSADYPSLTLDGNVHHPKKDMDGDRGFFDRPCPVQTGGESTDDCIYPRWADFNGDGRISLTDRMPVAGLAGHVPANKLNNDGTPNLTDLEVFFYTAIQSSDWDGPTTLSGLENLLMSGDIEIWTKTLRDRVKFFRSCGGGNVGITPTDLPRATDIRSSIRMKGQASIIDERSHADCNERHRQVYTLPSHDSTGQLITYVAYVETIGESNEVLGRFEYEFTLETGEDKFWDPGCVSTPELTDGSQADDNKRYPFVGYCITPIPGELADLNNLNQLLIKQGGEVVIWDPLASIEENRFRPLYGLADLGMSSPDLLAFNDNGLDQVLMASNINSDTSRNCLIWEPDKPDDFGNLDGLPEVESLPCSNFRPLAKLTDNLEVPGTEYDSEDYPHPARLTEARTIDRYNNDRDSEYFYSAVTMNNQGFALVTGRHEGAGQVCYFAPCETYRDPAPLRFASGSFYHYPNPGGKTDELHGTNFARDLNDDNVMVGQWSQYMRYYGGPFGDNTVYGSKGCFISSGSSYTVLSNNCSVVSLNNQEDVVGTEGGAVIWTSERWTIGAPPLVLNNIVTPPPSGVGADLSGSLEVNDNRWITVYGTYDGSFGYYLLTPLLGDKPNE